MNLCENCVHGEKTEQGDYLCNVWGYVEYSRNCGKYTPFNKNIKEYEDEGD
jgi:hypothetical protein